MLKKFIFFFSPIFCLSFLSCDNESDDAIFQSLSYSYLGYNIIGSQSSEFFFDGHHHHLYVKYAEDINDVLFEDQMPEWCYLENNPYYGQDQYFICIPEYYGEGERSGIIKFTIRSGGKTQNGRIVITQRALPVETLKRTEQSAIENYLSSYSIEDKLPNLKSVQTGEDTPFYRIDYNGSTFYLQILSIGNSSWKCKEGDEIYFQYATYNLLDYLNSNELNCPDTNLDSSKDYSTLILGDTYRSNMAFHLPLTLGLPLASRIRLLVPSELNLMYDADYFVPYMVEIQYYKWHY